MLSDAFRPVSKKLLKITHGEKAKVIFQKAKVQYSSHASHDRNPYLDIFIDEFLHGK